MNYRLFSPLMAAAALVSATFCAAPATAQTGRQTQSLAGSWRFSMSGPKPGEHQESLPVALSFSDTIALPGTTDTRKKGEAHGPGWNGALTRVYKFEGAAWYQRDIVIPAGWQNKRVHLVFGAYQIHAGFGLTKGRWAKIRSSRRRTRLRWALLRRVRTA